MVNALQTMIKVISIFGKYLIDNALNSFDIPVIK